MRLRIFRSGKGDCLLLTGKDGKRILVDGGLKGAYREHVGPWLDRYVRRRGGTLDAVYVSHIDADHIEGVLELLDNLVEWIVFDHQRSIGNNHIEEPERSRPPRPQQIWHNAFHEQMGRNAGAIADMYAAISRVLAVHADAEIRAFAERRENLATSKRQAILVSRRIGEDQLGIPLNPPAQGKLMYAREGAEPSAVGGMRIHVIGPFEEDLKKLRKEWNDWLEDHTATLERIRDASGQDEELLPDSELTGGAFWGLPSRALAEALGQRGNVTTPNLASLMLLVEEDGKTVLLTGDGHEDDILKGLRATGKLADDGGVHVDVLKVQHHGSEHNLDPERRPRNFAQVVTADHYVFCGDGAHHNPDPRIVEAFLKARLGPGRRTVNAGAGGDFKLWFSSSPSVIENEGYAGHMEKVRKLVRRYQRRSGGRLHYDFLERSSIEFRV